MALQVLVLGGAGFIGRHLCRSLKERGDRVTVVDHLAHGGLVPEVNQFYGLDLTNADEWPTSLTRTPYDHVYLLAAHVGVKTVNAAPYTTLRDNTEIVFNALEHLDIGRIFFASSSEVYATPKIIPTPETARCQIPDITKARSTYALSKMVGEAAVIQSGFPYIIGRFHNIYGPGQRPGWVIPQFIEWTKKRQDFRLVGGKVTRAFCYVADAVRAMVLCMDRAGEYIVHIGNDEEEIAIQDLAEKIITLEEGFHPQFLYYPSDHEFTLRRCPDIMLLRTFGFTPEVPLDQGLKSTYDSYSAY